MKYIAQVNTLLKKEPIQGSQLSDTQKIKVSAGTSYEVAEILESTGLHTKLKLGFDAGNWWIFNPHWNLLSVRLSAIFQLNLGNSNSLIYGTLCFLNSSGKEVLSVPATSGIAGYQYPGAHKTRGRGCIPPGDHWEINLPGYYLNTKGIEGLFYHITPDPYAGRSEIGLHRDANVPGSAGCIVVPSTRFTEVTQLLGKQPSGKINLKVQYS